MKDVFTMRKLSAIAVATFLGTIMQVNAQERDPTEYLDPVRVKATAKLDFEMKPRPTDPKEFPQYIEYLV